MKELKIADVPDHLFKYRPLGQFPEQLDWIKQTILDDKFYWPSPTEFNDPFDCVPLYVSPEGKDLTAFVNRMIKAERPNIARGERKKLLRGMIAARTPFEREAMQAGMTEALNESAVYSLAQAPDDILLWAHYGNAHQGVCLQFDGKELVREFWTAFPVKYSPDRPVIRVGFEDQTEQLEKLVLTKSEAWRYEQEWRFVEWRSGRAGLRRFKSNTLTGLIFGSRIAPAHRAAIEDWVKARPRPLELYKAECDVAHFRINLIPLNQTA